MTRGELLDWVRLSAAIIAVATLLVLSVSCETNMWRECRTHNSWSYCMRVLGHSR